MTDQTTDPKTTGAPPNAIADDLEQKPCILVADDDPDDIFLLRRAFLKAGLSHLMIEVSNGEEAINYLRGVPPFDNRKRHPFPNLLLLDLKMPRVDGFGVLTWLKWRPYMQGLPVVVLTASPLESDKEMALKLGARDFVTKPSDLGDLMTLAKRLHEQWLVRWAVNSLA